MLMNRNGYNSKNIIPHDERRHELDENASGHTSCHDATTAITSHVPEFSLHSSKHRLLLYYNYSPYPAQVAPSPIPYNHTRNQIMALNSDSSAAHMFSNETTNELNNAMVKDMLFSLFNFVWFWMK